MWVPVLVLDASVSVLLPANGLGKIAEDGSNAWAHAIRVWDWDEVPGFGLVHALVVGVTGGNEPVDRNHFPLSALCNFIC